MNQINIELTKEQITSITKQVRDSGEADYRFDLNLLEGKLSENKWAGILETVEIKKDYRAWDTGNIAVEYASYGNPSGIAKTEAKFVAYILVDQDQDDRIVFFIKTEILLAMCRKYKVSKDLEMWQIHENSTNQIVFQSPNKQTVMDLKIKLDSGTGFDGKTPRFFAQDYRLCDSE